MNRSPNSMHPLQPAVASRLSALALASLLTATTLAGMHALAAVENAPAQVAQAPQLRA